MVSLTMGAVGTCSIQTANTAEGEVRRSELDCKMCRRLERGCESVTTYGNEKNGGVTFFQPVRLHGAGRYIIKASYHVICKHDLHDTR